MTTKEQERDFSVQSRVRQAQTMISADHPASRTVQRISL